jgi:hypothetical protein
MSSGGGMMVSGKQARLDQAFADAGLHIVGVQEARIQQNVDCSRANYRIIGSSATEQGAHGTQLWLAHSSKPVIIAVVPHCPRLLLAVVRVLGKELLVVVGHSPTEAKEADAAIFWESVAREVCRLQAR